MDDDQLARHNDTLKRLDDMVSLMRKSSQYHAFRFNTGMNSQCHVQKQHCFIDGIHNPNATNTQVSLYEDGVLIYNDTIAPGGVTPPLAIPFMRECVLLTDGNAVTIWGRIRG